MFDFLKKKIGGFVDKLKKTEEKKAKPPEKKPAPKPAEKEPAPVVKEKKPAKGKAVPKAGKKEPEPVEEKAAPVIEEKPKEPVQEKPEEIEPVEAEPVSETKALPVEEKPFPEPEAPAEEPPPVKEPATEKKPKKRIKLGTVGRIKGFITREVEITEGDVGELLENLELELLESDVELSVAESIREELTEKLIGAKVKKDDLHNYISNSIRETLIHTITNENVFDIVEKIKESEKPVKIMFLGINGAGKTTTIAKVARLLMDNGQRVVFAAADTFRAAAIEQMGIHASRLEVKMIKREYGSDPTSVAYDAVNYARARGIDAVLIDTAGRQDTNISLINEIKKMTRVIEPEIKLYIGESIAGNAIIEQVQTFNREIGLDGVILTKLDCDPKGGTMLSINKTTNVPIIYIGTGQNYEDLEAFRPARIVERIVE
ncbi:signal recognition particle-docking protein FtsY [Candidatus Micrarchaeota archaeon]|nr:signal recognition particle-docking protein FtsY [Candidatus Micrarchaeota archaeon]